jgi:hypothetical protein
MKKFVALILLLGGLISCVSAQHKTNLNDTIQPKRIKVPVRHQRLPPRRGLKVVDSAIKDTQKVRPH